MPSFPEITEAEVLHCANAPHGFADFVHGRAGGRAIITFSDRSDHRRNLSLGTSLLSALGAVLSIYPADGCWSDLSVRLDADPIRTHGTGENPLHIDLVDREHPPRYIALYCVRNDPLGGGATALSDLWAASTELSAADRAVLSEAAYSYWADEGVYGVGASVPKFRIIPPDLQPGTVIRFTAKMLPHLRRGDLVEPRLRATAAAAFGRMVLSARQNAWRTVLRPGQMIVFDQFRYAHGRMPLGKGQETVPLTSRRLLRQAYVSGWRMR